MQLNQRGAIPLLVLIALIGVIAFLAVSWVGPFQEGSFFNSLFGKPSSHAAEAGVFFVDANNNLISETSSNMVKVQLNPPWPVNAVPSAAVSLENPFIKSANAQTSNSTGFKVIASSDDV